MSKFIIDWISIFSGKRNNQKSFEEIVSGCKANRISVKNLFSLLKAVNYVTALFEKLTFRKNEII